jgi:hypothetical protein
MTLSHRSNRPSCLSLTGSLVEKSAVVLLMSLCAGYADAGIITGTIRSLETGKPISAVTISVEGTGHSIPANDSGQYRLVLKPGTYRLKFSHVAYYSAFHEVELSDSAVVDVSLREAAIRIPGIKVYDRAYDPAQRIIVEAIRRKKEILNQLQNYRCNTYLKTVVRNSDKNDADTIEYILESQLQCYWKQPNKYKEVIVSRRQTSNVKAQLNRSSLETIPNFHMDRVPFDRYAIISPLATDALEYYNYYLLDTFFIDKQRVFRLEVEPKNDTDPLVAGTIDIADSTFNVVGVDGGPGAGIYHPFMKDFHYSQRFAEFEHRFWMPVDIRWNYVLNFIFPVERSWRVDEVAALYDYSFDTAMPDRIFDYALEIANEADDIDSVTWNLKQAIPLTLEERHAYNRIDSLVHAPKPLHKKMLSALGFLNRSMADYRVFHFNRVEGASLGFGHYWWDVSPHVNLDIYTGYAFSRRRWEHRYGIYYLFSFGRPMYAGIKYRDEITHRPVMLASPDFDPTSWNLLAKTDPYDYYLEKGV